MGLRVRNIIEDTIITKPCYLLEIPIMATSTKVFNKNPASFWSITIIIAEALSKRIGLFTPRNPKP